MKHNLITDDMIRADIVARIEAHKDIAPVNYDDAMLIIDMAAEHFEVDRDRAYMAWASNVPDHRDAAREARVA